MKRAKRWPAAGLLILTLGLFAGCKGSADEQLRAAREQLDQGQLGPAIEGAKRVLADNHSSSEARLLFGRALLEAGDAVGAGIELKRAQQLKPDAEPVMAALARALLAQRKPDAVIDEFAKVEPQDPTIRADLKTTVAAAHLARHELEPARKALQAGLAANGSWPAAMVLQARLQLIDGHMAAAEATLAAAAERNPKSADVWRATADLRRYRRDAGAALVAYRKAVQLNPRDIEAHAGAISLLLAGQDTASLDEHVALLRSVAAGHPQTRWFDAVLAYRKGAFKQADEILMKLVDLAPDDPKVLQLAGETAEQLGALERAETMLTRALQADPARSAAAESLARVQMRREQPEKVPDTLAPHLKARESARLLTLAAQAQLQRGDAKEARNLLERAAKVDASDTRSRMGLALLKIGAGDAAAGIQQLDALSARERGHEASVALLSVALDRRDATLAINVLDRLDQRKSMPPAALANLRGRTLMTMGQLAQARQSFEKAASLDKAMFAPVESLAALDVQERHPEQAKARLDERLRANPEHTAALLARAEVERLSGGKPEAIEALLRKALDLEPGNAHARRGLVAVLVGTRRSAEALALAQKGLSASQPTLEQMLLVGEAQLADRQAMQALQLFQQAATRFPKAVAVHSGMGTVLVAVGQRQPARAAFQQALALDPTHDRTLEQLARLDIAEGRLADATALVQAWRKREPANVAAALLQGDVAFAKRDFASAAQTYLAVVQRQPTADAVMRAHAALVQAGRAADATRLEAQWFAAHPADVALRASLADAATKAGDDATAERRYREVLERAPNHVFALNNLATTLLRLNKTGALELARRANEQAPRRAELMDTLAQAQLQAGQTAQALSTQREAVQLEPALPELRLTLAKILLQSELREEAVRELRQLLAPGSKLRDRAEAERLLKSAGG